MLKNRLFTTLFCFFAILLIITFSIALPIYVRPFYYAHIDAYNLEEVTGKSREQIVSAYDEVLDYLTIPGKEFGTGDFLYSDEGKSHFEDCKVLFDLNAVVLIVSLLGIVILFILKKKSVFSLSRPFGKHISFSIGSFTLAFFLVLGGICSIDFNTAFVVFHKIFFYGKSNWVFDAGTDQIITALPQQFFLNCGILIVSTIVVVSIVLICFGVFSKHKK